MSVVITVNMDKAKAITHEHRRAARAKEFEPYDQIMALQIPGQSTTDAEKARAAIRAKYATIQTNIDAATTPDQLTTIIKALPKSTAGDGCTTILGDSDGNLINVKPGPDGRLLVEVRPES